METDRNLLFGVLALQADLIDADQLARACSDWAARKSAPLADLLRERGWISAEDRAHVEFLLERKLRKHGDAHAGLAAAADEHVRSLIAAADDADIRLTIADLPRRDGPDPESTISYSPGTRDRYTLTRMHARGGLGQVWLARDADLGRPVALKELRPERGDDPALAARFVEEARVTGQLEHPGIVPVYELARRPGDGRPFYTMRFIRGRTLAQAARDYHAKAAAGRAGPLDLAALLNAFVAVCNAVAYAHSRGVLHRDLKPQNVVMGDFGEVVVLDWGLAKLIDRPDEAAALSMVAPDPATAHDATLPGQVLGTPAYIPPEQAEGGAVDVRCDVYGLGAILYEILAGRPPFRGDDTGDLLRRVLREAPDRPRDVVPTTPRALEAVCLKALAKAPAGRYDSASDLADEVRRFLADEPARAYPEPVAARAGRWMRRHRTLVSGAAVLLVTVAVAAAAGVVLLGRKNREVAAERNAARVAADQAEAVNAFLSDDLLGQADPDVNSRDRKVTVEELLRRAAGKIDGNAKFADRPEVEATLRLTLGKTFFKLSDLPQAERHLRRAVALRRRALGPEDSRTLAAQEALADFVNRGLERPDEAVSLARQTWEARARVLGPEHIDTLDSLDTYGNSLRRAGRLEEGGVLLRTCLEARRRILGPRNKETLVTSGNLAMTLVPRGEWDEALPLVRDLVDAFRELGVETELALNVSVLAGVLHLKGELAEAETLLRTSIERASRHLGPENYQTDRLRSLLVRVWIDQGRAGPAVALARKTLASRRRNLPPGHAALAPLLMDLGYGLARLGQFDEAEAILDEALKIFAVAPTYQPYYAPWSECWLGVSFAGRRRFAEAEPLLLAAEAKLRATASTPRRYRREAVAQLVTLYDAWGKPDQAARWRHALADAEAPPRAAEPGR